MPDSTTNDLDRLEALHKAAVEELAYENRTDLVDSIPSLVKEIREGRAALVEARAERDQLRAAINQTLSENGHLADGDNCTLIHLKRSIAELEVGR